MMRSNAAEPTKRCAAGARERKLCVGEYLKRAFRRRRRLSEVPLVKVPRGLGCVERTAADETGGRRSEAAAH